MNSKIPGSSISEQEPILQLAKPVMTQLNYFLNLPAETREWFEDDINRNYNKISA